MLSIFDFELLLKHCVNFIKKIRLPAKKLHCLDIVEAFINVETALLSLAARRFINLLLRLSSYEINQHAACCEKENEESAPADLLKNDD